MRHGLLTRADALVDGHTIRSLDRAVAHGRLAPIARGLYVADHTSDLDLAWLRELHALQHRCPSAAAARRAAALLHDLDGFHRAWTQDRPVDALLPMSARLRDPRASRSRTLVESQVVLVDGLRTTSLARTIADLGAICSADVVEVALESVLRGDDPRRPDVWHEDRLPAVIDIVQANPRVPGHDIARIVLRRRGDVLPTGSAAETNVWIECRRLGLLSSLRRQVRVRIVDRSGRVIWTFWADLGELERRLLVEIDGTEYHAGNERVARDYRRDNELQRAFTVLRFPATDPPRRIAEDIGRRLADLTPTPLGGQLVRTDLGVDLHL